MKPASRFFWLLPLFSLMSPPLTALPATIFTRQVLLDFETKGQLLASESADQIRLHQNSFNCAPVDPGNSCFEAEYPSFLETPLIFRPASPAVINGYCRSLRLWFFNDGSKKRITIHLKDSFGLPRTLPPLFVQHNGWRRLTIPVGYRVNQSDFGPGLKSSLELTRLTIYFTKSPGILRQIIRIDDITAVVRPKIKKIPLPEALTPAE